MRCTFGISPLWFEPRSGHMWESQSSAYGWSGCFSPGSVCVAHLESHRCGSSLAQVTCGKVKVLLTDGQVVFPWVPRFSPTFDERSAQYK